MHRARPHDLLRLSGATVLPVGAPAWAVHALRLTPWVVVRRGPAPDGLIAVGVRGFTRSDRYGTYMALDQVREVVAPEALVHNTVGRVLPALCAVRSVRPLLDNKGLAWGPTGSVGFELATGHAIVTPDSDLDLLIRTCDVAGVLPTLMRLHHEFDALAGRVDCQVETRTGAVALAELVGDAPDVLVRTTDGPRLVARESVS